MPSPSPSPPSPPLPPASSLLLFSSPTAPPLHPLSLSPASTPHPWLIPSSIKQYTLVHLLDRPGARCLLGLKRRGFGVGLWNGFGGKVERGETPVRAAAREVQEECGLRVREGALVPRGRLLFPSDPALGRETTATTPLIHLFVCEEWEGEPEPSEEMEPRWFALPGVTDSTYPPIPYTQSWPEVRLYLPHLLALPASSPAKIFGQADYVVAGEGAGEVREAGLGRWGFWLVE